MRDHWVVLIEHLLPVGWAPIDAAELEMLYIESRLVDAGIDVVFDPRRPGDSYASRSTGILLKLMVPAEDLQRAQQLLQEIQT